MVGKIKTIGKIIGPVLQWMGPPVRIAQEGEWTVFESSSMRYKLPQRAVGGKLSRELCVSADVARYIKQSDVIEIADDYTLTINGITRIRLYEDKCEPLQPPRFEPLAVAVIGKHQFDAVVEKLMRVRPHDVEVSAGERGIVLKATRLEAVAEVALTAAVKIPLEPIYVRAEAFRAVRSLPLVGRVEIALGGEPAKAEATGEVKYKTSAVQIRAVGEVEYTAWWV